VETGAADNIKREAVHRKNKKDRLFEAALSSLTPRGVLRSVLYFLLTFGPELPDEPELGLETDPELLDEPELGLETDLEGCLGRLVEILLGLDDFWSEDLPGRDLMIEIPELSFESPDFPLSQPSSLYSLLLVDFDLPVSSTGAFLVTGGRFPEPPPLPSSMALPGLFTLEPP